MTASSRMAARPKSDRAIVAIAALLLVVGGGLLDADYGWRHAAMYGLGGLMGLVLYHAAFGFSASWRALILDRRGGGIRLHLLMIALTTIVFLPLLHQGSLFGQGVVGAVAPAGIAVLAGSFLFGIGMQLGGGCASGTLYTAGGGNTRMMVTLVAFIAGSLLGSLHLPWWLETPSLQVGSILEETGLFPALGLQLALLGGVAALTLHLEKRRHGAIERSQVATPRSLRTLIQGPWPLLWGAIGLAFLNIATLAVSGHPWSITFGFALWGAKISGALGLDVAGWTFWTWPFPANALNRSVFADETSVMNFGILIGAALAAGLAGKMAPARRIPLRSLLAAVIGGVLMGYGARLAFGCNIGAFFSGIASSSLHGWLWFASALAGTFIGARLRPLFAIH